MELSTDVIQRAIENLKNQRVAPLPPAIWVPVPGWVLSARYKGYGRPRKSDYDYVDLTNI